VARDGLCGCACRQDRGRATGHHESGSAGDTKISQITCRSCGGALKPENIKMVAGAPMVECPYCGTTYQMTEEPKW